MDDQELELAAEETELDTATLERAAEEAPIIKLVNLILTDSVKRGRERYSHRAVRAGDARKVPRRRRTADGDEPAAAAEGCDHQPLEDHGQAGHRGKAIAARRPHHDQVQAGRQEEGTRFPRLHGSDAVRRKNRPPVAGQREPAAGHDQAGLRAGVAEEIRAEHFEAVRHGAGHRADGFGQDEHPVFVGRAAEHRGYQHHDRGRPGRVSVGRASTRCR